MYTTFWGKRKSQKELTENEQKLKTICEHTNTFEEWENAIEKWRKEIKNELPHATFRHNCALKAHHCGWRSKERQNWYQRLPEKRQKQFQHDWLNLEKFPTKMDLLKVYPEAKTARGLRDGAGIYCQPPLPDRRALHQERVKRADNAQKYPDVSQKIQDVGYKIKDMIDRGSDTVTVAGVSKKLNISKKTVILALDFLQQVYKEEEGSILTIDGKVRGKIEKKDPAKAEPEEEFPGFDNVYRMLILANTSLGSKYQQLTHVYTMMAEAEKRNVKFAAVVGGAVAAKPTKATASELFLYEPDEIAEYLVKYWPRQSFHTYFLAGREELSWGMNVAEKFCGDPTRDDLRYLGEWSANMGIGGSDTKLKLVYPHSGAMRTYTIGYRPEKALRAFLTFILSQIRGKGISEAPNVVFHGRVAAQGETNSAIKNILCPGMTAQTPSMEAAEMMPTVGGIIVEMRFDKKGNLLKDFDAKGKPQKGGITTTYYDLSPDTIANDYGEFPEPGDNCTPHEKNMLAVLQNQAERKGEISRKLDCSTETVDDLFASLQEKGFDVKQSNATKRIVWTPKQKTKFSPRKIEVKERYVFGTSSDIHYGSRKQQPALVRMAYEYAKDIWKAKIMLNCGDIHDGQNMYRGQKAEVFAHSLEKQLAVAARELPHEPKTIGIGGNHDESFWKALTDVFVDYYGLEAWPDLTQYADIMLQLSKKHPGFHYLGVKNPTEFCMEAQTKIDVHGTIIEDKGVKGLVLLFLHPKGGLGQTKTYKGQKFIESLAKLCLSHIFANIDKIHDIPHVYILGHWHSNLYFRYAGIDFYLLPTFQKNTTFIKRLGLSSDVGSWMVQSETDAKNHIVKNTVKYLDLIPYLKERDYPAK